MHGKTKTIQKKTTKTKLLIAVGKCASSMRAPYRGSLHPTLQTNKNSSLGKEKANKKHS